MKKSYLKTIISLILVASLSLTSFVFVKSDKMSNLQKQKESIAKQKEKYKKKKSDVEAYIDNVDQKLTNVSTEIYSLSKKLSKTKVKIKKTKVKLKKAKASVATQNADMTKRIQFMYENGDSEMLDMLLNSKSISDFLNKAEYISDLSKYDRKMFNKLKDTQNKIDKAKNDLYKEKNNIVKLTKKQKSEKNSLKKLEASKKKELSGYNRLIKNTKESEARIAAEIRAQQAAIEAAERAEEARQNQQANNNSNNNSNNTNNNSSNNNNTAPKKKSVGGGWTWPCPSSHTITSEFGYRSDPFGGSGGGYHSGLDIGAPAGTPIVAACSGTVAWSNFSSTAGNWIGISHGNGVVSVYMHMSARIAQAGQHVEAGQTIGLVGTTGSSTGNHLHFGVQVNGSYVNPHSYVG